MVWFFFNSVWEGIFIPYTGSCIAIYSYVHNVQSPVDVRTRVACPIRRALNRLPWQRLICVKQRRHVMNTMEICVKAMQNKAITSDVVLCWPVPHTIHGRPGVKLIHGVTVVSGGIGDKESVNGAGAVTRRTRLQCLTYKMQHYH